MDMLRIALRRGGTGLQLLHSADVTHSLRFASESAFVI